MHTHEVTHWKFFIARTTELSLHAALQWNCLAGYQKYASKRYLLGAEHRTFYEINDLLNKLLGRKE